MECKRCKRIPQLYFSNSNIFVQLPTHHHTALFEQTLRENQYSYEVLPEGYLVRSVDFEQYITFLKSMVFNSVEQKDVKIIPLKNEETIHFSMLKHYRSLKEWTTLYEYREVVRIIETANVRTFFQPIIHVKTGKIYGYEALSRGVYPDGSLMNPKMLFQQAKEMDLLFFLDRICREASIRSAAQQKIKSKIFVNFIPTAIYEPTLCLQSTVRILSEVDIQPEQVIFEVVESEKVLDFEHLNTILDYYKEQGFSTALDDVGSGYADTQALLKLQPNYMKIDRSIIHNIHLNNASQNLLDQYIFEGMKMKAIILAEGVETIEEYNYLKTKAIDLMQGYFFGKPQLIPADMVLAP